MEYSSKDIKLTFVTEDGVEIDLDRLTKSAKEPSFTLPSGLSREQRRKYIKDKANLSLESHAGKPIKVIYTPFMLEGGIGGGLTNYIGSYLSGFVNGVGWKTSTILDVYKIEGEWYAETKNTVYNVKEG